MILIPDKLIEILGQTDARGRVAVLHLHWTAPAAAGTVVEPAETQLIVPGSMTSNKHYSDFTMEILLSSSDRLSYLLVRDTTTS